MKNKIIKGNCIEEMKKISNESIDCIITDPPFNISQDKKELSRKTMKSPMFAKRTSIRLDFGDWDKMGELKFKKFTKKWFKECVRVLKPKGWFFCFFSKERTGYFTDPLDGLFIKNGFKTRTIICWHKCIASGEKLIIKQGDKIKILKVKDIFRLVNKEKIYTVGLLNNKKVGWVRIKNISFSHREKGKKVILKNGEIIKVSKKHRFPVNRLDNLVDVENIKKEDFLFTCNAFPKLERKNNYDFGRFIGLFLSEGSFSYNSHLGCMFSLHKKETELYEFIKFFCENIGITSYSYDYGNCKHVRINNKSIFELVKQVVVGDTARTKHLKFNFLSYGHNFIKGVFDGFMQGDGWWDSKNNRYRFNLTRNKKLVDDLRVICKFLGYGMSCFKRLVYNKQTQKYYKIFEIEIKKREIIQKIKINDIKDDLELNYYDIEIDSKKHLFCNFLGVISHNTNPVPSFRKVNFLSSCEFCVVGSKGESRLPNFLMQKEMHNFFETPNKSSYGKTKHPTEKPERLIEWLVKIGSKEGATILDPFLGSGTTAIACLKLNRKFIGIEKEEEYVKIANARIKPFLEQKKLS